MRHYLTNDNQVLWRHMSDHIWLHYAKIELNVIIINVAEKQILLTSKCPQIARFMGPTWGPSGSCRPQVGPMLATWTLLSGSVPHIYRPWALSSLCDCVHTCYPAVPSAGTIITIKLGKWLISKFLNCYICTHSCWPTKLNTVLVHSINSTKRPHRSIALRT